MNRTRYEPIPETADEEIIDLHTIIPHPPSYNYNSGIPNSPPPSFRSSQSVQLELDRSINTTPVPPSLPISSPDDSTNPTQPQMQDLHLRIQRLEESIGRLLLEKEGQPQSSRARNNCCVTFSTDDDAEAMRLMGVGSRDNCCVRYEGRSGKESRKRQLEGVFIVIGLALFLVGIFVVLMKSIEHSRPGSDQRA